jgi:ribonucleotide reductase alpha subunit
MEINHKILSDIVVWNKYAKHLKEKQRRETWEELVTRNMEMHIRKFPQLEKLIRTNYELVFEKKVLPSMRSLQFGGKPIEVNHTRIFNCSYLHIDDYRAFNETMFLLLSGTGVGYSISRNHIDKLPAISKPTKQRRFLIPDNIEGWADAVKVLMKSYFGLSSWKPNFDYRAIREKGEPLLTSGGVAPGPEPLKICLTHIEAILDRKKDGEKLTSLECHDILCHIANAVLAGGIRRSAMIALFDHDDEDMLTCKSGNWWEINPQRGRANNSVKILRNGPVMKNDFLELWKKVEASNAGEPGFLFTNDLELGTNPCFAGEMRLLTSEGYISFEELSKREDIQIIDSYGLGRDGSVWKTGTRDVIEVRLDNDTFIRCTPDHMFDTLVGPIEAHNLWGREVRTYDAGANDTGIAKVVDVIRTGDICDVYDFYIDGPNHWGVVEGVVAHNCGEIALNSFQMCNLVEINASDIIDQFDFEERTAAAAFIGTLQASYTDFHYLRPEWKEVTEREALLGVGMTGIASGAVLNLDLPEAAETAVRTNKFVANTIGINESARITTIKPSGTASIVLGCSSGVHAWHSKYYLRRMRVGKSEALYTYLYINHPELLEDSVYSSNEAYVCVPIAAPEGAITRDSESAITFLERVKLLHEKWIKPGHIYGENTHNVSATVTLKPNEWRSVGEWLWENQNHYNGLSFLPEDLGSYQQTPFEEIDEAKYLELSKVLTGIDVANIVEIVDNTNLAGELACGAGGCEIS